jgi:acetyltransferase-like isoleucine patch superfamily enzyme
MYEHARLLAKSAACSVIFRIHGFHADAATCDGLLPVLHGGGEVFIRGRLALRARVARCEIGADRGGRLEIGSRVFINQGASVVAAEYIEIGDDCRIGDFAAVYDSNYHALEPGRPLSPAPVVIGRNVWLGRQAIVLPGSRLGDHVVVGAGAVVTGEIPDRVLVAGNPAKIIRTLDVPDDWRRG